MASKAAGWFSASACALTSTITSEHIEKYLCTRKNAVTPPGSSDFSKLGYNVRNILPGRAVSWTSLARVRQYRAVASNAMTVNQL